MIIMISITTQKFLKWETGNFATWLELENLPTKAGTDDFVEKTDFHDKLKHLNKKVPSNETCTDYKWIKLAIS